MVGESVGPFQMHRLEITKQTVNLRHTMKQRTHIISFQQKANQQKVISKFFSLTQIVNRRDWRILAGNEKRIARDCLNQANQFNQINHIISH